jgi:S1-C subfamily serine protease
VIAAVHLGSPARRKARTIPSVFVVALLAIAGCSTLQVPAPVELARKGVARVVVRRTDARLQAGSAGIVGQDGLLVTNAHVVVDDDGRPIEDLFVFLPAGAGIVRCAARLIALSSTSGLDLALLKAVNPPPGLTVLELSVDPVAPGTRIFIVGHPDAQPETIVSAGRLVGVVRDEPFLRAEPLLREGESGSPLLDAQGRVVGVGRDVEPGPNPPSTAYTSAISGRALKRWLREAGFTGR